MTPDVTGASVPVTAGRVAAVIFDLDNCLCAAAAVGTDLFVPAFAAIRSANCGTLDEPALQRAFDDCWYSPFDAVAKRHGFSQNMLEAGCIAFARLEITGRLSAYPDLHLVRELPVRRHLVTSGFRRLQASKIRALEMEAWFDSITIDAIDEVAHAGKQAAFEAILTADRLRPHQVLVVGDSLASELTAGRRLGMTTVQILRPGVGRAAEVDHHITSLQELWPLIGSASPADRGDMT